MIHTFVLHSKPMTTSSVYAEKDPDSIYEEFTYEEMEEYETEYRDNDAGRMDDLILKYGY